MSQILDSTEKDGRLTSVTFLDVHGSVHTLTFYPEGTNVAHDDEPAPRIVGENVPAHDFTDPRDAVTAFERGEV